MATGAALGRWAHAIVEDLEGDVVIGGEVSLEPGEGRGARLLWRIPVERGA